MKPPVLKTNPEFDAFYTEVCTAMAGAAKKHPSIRNIEIIGILGRMTGYCVAMCHPDERDLARQTAIVNLDKAVEDAASSGSPTSGRA